MEYFSSKDLKFFSTNHDWQDSKNRQKFDLSLAGLKGLKTELELMKAIHLKLLQPFHSE